MTTPATVDSTITSATSSLQGDLLTVGGIAVGVGAAVFALRKGWKFFRSMI